MIGLRISILILFCLFQVRAFATVRQLPDTLLTEQEITWLQNNKKNLRYAPNPSWPPGDFINENGEHKGIVSDYIKIFEAKLGVEFQKVYYKNWNDITQGLLKSEVDFVGAMMRTKERESQFNFTDVFLKVPLVILVRNDYQHKFDKNSIKNMKLASVKGYITQDYVEKIFQHKKITEYDDDLTALLQTSMGNTDGTIVDLMTASYLVEKYGINNLSIGTELDFIWELRFAFNKDKAIFASIINKVLGTIDETERQEIYRKWVSIHPIGTQSFFERNSRFFIITGILFIIIFIIVFNYTIVLRKQVHKRTEQLNTELDQKIKAVELSKKNESRLESLFEISKHTGTIESLFKFALAESVKLTESKRGTLLRYDKGNKTFTSQGFYDTENTSEDQSLTNSQYTFNDLGNCVSIIPDRIPYKIDACANCINHLNNRCPLGIGQFKHTLVVPIVEDNETEALLLLADKETEYDNSDSKQVILLMNSVWQLLNKQKWQEQLIAAKEKAEESDRLKSAFLANLSHEIRTPMNGILGFTELIKKPTLLPEKRNSYIEIIQKSGNYLLSIISDIIEISKIDSGLIKLNYTAVNIHQLMKDIFREISGTVPHEKQISIILDAPEILDSTLLLVDEIKLKQIINNLLTNAVKFTQKGNVTLGYNIIDNNKLIIFVKDTGIGIDQKFHEIIFQRFRQAEDDSNGLQSGSGLGLAISKAYIEMMGGTISLESEVNRGTIFTLSIPVEVKPEEINSTPEEITEKKTHDFSHKLKLLIAEDNDVNYLFVSEVLPDSEFEKIRAHNGRETIELFKKYPDIDLVLMDIKMPEIDGYEALKLIRQINKDIPVIAQTAYALSEEVTTIKLAGFTEYLSKPISRQKLLETIENVLAHDANNKNRI